MNATYAATRLDVLVVGVANIDLVTRVPALPGEGQTAFGGDLIARPGGKGLNQALAAGDEQHWLPRPVTTRGAISSRTHSPELPSIPPRSHYNPATPQQS